MILRRRIPPIQRRQRTNGSHGPRGHPFDPLCFPRADNKPVHTEYKILLKKGKVIRIQDMGFITQIFSKLHYGRSDDSTDSNHYYSTPTPDQSNLRPTGRKIIARQGAAISPPDRMVQSLDLPQSRFIDSRIRYLAGRFLKRFFV